jgi:hypothetical protein
MSAAHLCGALVVALLLPACEPPPPELPPVQPYDTVALMAIRYKVVLIAGDGRLPVFDNATEGVAARMHMRGSVTTDDIQRLSAAPAVITQDGVRSASLAHVLEAISTMKPGQEKAASCSLPHTARHIAAFRWR